MHRLLSIGIQRAERGCQAIVSAALTLVVMAADAFAQQPQIDPALRRLLEPQLQQEIVALARARPQALATEVPLSRVYSLQADAAGRVLVGLFVELRGADALAQLRAAGAEIGSVVGDIATVRMPIEALAELENLPLTRVQAARVLSAVHDSSMRAIRASNVRQRTTSGWSGAAGAGAIVGVIDTGIDILHPDFRDDAGFTRIVGLWDLTFGSNPPSGASYGFYCSGNAVQLTIATGDNFACPTRDLNGHGTHVAGTAAGSGAGGLPAFAYAGVAPAASLLIARAGDGSFSEDRVADAMVWMKRESQALGRPAVVNMSFGHQFGPHDGSLLFERMIDGAAAPGFIVVTSSGNEGANNNTMPATSPRLIHARVLATGVGHSLTFDIPAYTPGVSRCSGNVLAFSVWYDVRDRLQVTLVRPNGTTVVARAGVMARVESNDVQGHVVIENAYPLSAFPVTAEAYVQVDGCQSSGVPAAGSWEIRLTPEPAGSATGNPVDVYLHTVLLGAAGTASGGSGFDNRFVVGSPGNARRSITVGAFATRNCWPLASGAESCYAAREQVGDLARFSSGGPTRDGRIKPEITAPGIGIMSALSRDRSAPASRLGPGGRHWTMEGTSMAAPHVTGAIALLLEQRPTLTPEDLVEVLRATGRQDSFTTGVFSAAAGAQPSDWWGYGKLDVAAALARLGVGGSVAAVTIAPRLDTLPQGASRQLHARATNLLGDTLFATINWTSLDPSVATVDFAGTVRALQPGVARVVATAETRADTARVAVVPPAVLAISGRAAAPARPVLGRKDTFLPLLALRLEARGPEAILLRAIGFELEGVDPNVTVSVLEDVAGDGVPRPGARILGSLRVLRLEGTRATTVSTDTFTIGANGSRHVIMGIAVSGAAVNGASFGALVLPGLARTTNLLSLATNRVTLGEATAAIGVTTVLLEDELFALSENPVRSQSVRLNFAERPTSAEIYTITGGRVVDLLPRITGLSHVWDLKNDRGEQVVAGVYLLLLRVRGQLIREKLMVLRREGGE